MVRTYAYANSASIQHKHILGQQQDNMVDNTDYKIYTETTSRRPPKYTSDPSRNDAEETCNLLDRKSVV